MKPTNFQYPILNKVLLFSLLLLVLVQQAAHAQTDAFSIEVAVAERSELEQQDAYTAGLRRVFLRNSGDKTILNRDAIRQALKQAENYVNSFSYRKPPPGTVIASDTPITSKVQQSGQATQLMLVSFDRELVSQIISNSAPANADSEPDSAPVVTYVASNSALVWLLIRDEERDILISDPAAANVQKRGREIAGAAGISLVYPAGDEEDQQLLFAEEIEAQTFNPDNLDAIRSRYAQDTLLVGFLTRDGVRGWVGQWTRVSGEPQQQQQQQAEFAASTLDQALKDGLGILNSVAEIDETYRYGGSASSDTEGLVWVGTVDSTEDYSRIMRFFESIDAVATVYPKEVQPSSMVFSVIPRSALVDIESVLFDVSWLQRTTQPFNNDINSLARNVDLSITFSR